MTCGYKVSPRKFCSEGFQDLLVDLVVFADENVQVLDRQAAFLRSI